MFDFVQKNINNLIIVVLLSIALEIIAMFGLLALVIGILFTIFWADLGIFYLYGKVYKEGEKPEGNIAGSESSSQPSVS